MRRGGRVNGRSAPQLGLQSDRHGDSRARGGPAHAARRLSCARILQRVLGIRTVWAQGISSSPALQMARASSMPPRLFQLAGEIPLTATIFRWESAVCVIVEIAVVAGVMWLCAPGDGRGRSAADLGIDLSAGVAAPPAKATR